MTLHKLNNKKLRQRAYRKIWHVLHLYPGISLTMLQAAIGPQFRTETWRPILEHMIRIGVVTRETTDPIEGPGGRAITHTKLYLNHDKELA